MTIAYLNGTFLPLEKAQVPAMDRGFLFGDSVYEVIPVFGGKLFRFEQHFARLQRSLKALAFDLELDLIHWRQILEKLIEQNQGSEQSIYLQISRGPVAKRDYLIPEKPTPTFFAFSTEIPALDMTQLRQGIAAITLEDNRWLGCFIKSTNLLPNILLRTEAQQQHAQEAILIRDNYVSEGTASNVFIVLHGEIKTPPLDSTILGGITRDLVIELAHQHQLPLQEEPISQEQLLMADEIWVTSSTKHIRPVLKLNQQPVANGQIGPIWEKMIEIYQDYKRQLEMS